VGKIQQLHNREKELFVGLKGLNKCGHTKLLIFLGFVNVFGGVEELH